MFQKEIEHLYNNDIFIALCKRYGGDNFEDLRQEIIVMIMEMPQDKLSHIVDSNYLLPYALQMVRFQTSTHPRSQGTKFNKLFNQKNQSIDEIYHPTEYEPDLELNFIDSKIILKKIWDDSSSQDNKYFYHSRLVLEKLKYKHFTMLSKVTKIPYKSVLDAVKQYRNYLDQWQKNN